MPTIINFGGWFGSDSDTPTPTPRTGDDVVKIYENLMTNRKYTVEDNTGSQSTSHVLIPYSDFGLTDPSEILVKGKYIILDFKPMREFSKCTKYSTDMTTATYEAPHYYIEDIYPRITTAILYVDFTLASGDEEDKKYGGGVYCDTFCSVPIGVSLASANEQGVNIQTISFSVKLTKSGFLVTQHDNDVYLERFNRLNGSKASDEVLTRFYAVTDSTTTLSVPKFGVFDGQFVTTSIS